jgi:Holliday junction resolvase RusA-like endonuclease
MRMSPAEFEALRSRGLKVISATKAVAAVRPAKARTVTPSPVKDPKTLGGAEAAPGMVADAAGTLYPATAYRNSSGNAAHPGDPWSYGPCEMPGQLCSKSNSRKIVRMGNRIAVIKSAEARAYVDTFLRTMPKPAVPFEGPVCFVAQVYYADRRRDLDVALLQDCLQAHGIIKNDRQVVEIHAHRYISKDNPRTWFLLTSTEPSTQD